MRDKEWNVVKVRDRGFGRVNGIDEIIEFIGFFKKFS